ncbi:hypothetical protein Q7C36_003753 [Tachysurus vachellii]|uniref:Uncharacterized protein n=1 Tax=Tachysurus vachellii TaxID=175792 RepID=A0AA88T7Q3_TACVA|nr:hypothetical protein Q7C36_003753 [Tachysurus vachellii]
METVCEERRKTGKAVLRHPRAPSQTAGISVQTNYKGTSATGSDPKRINRNSKNVQISTLSCISVFSLQILTHTVQRSLILAGQKDPSSVRLHWCKPHWRGPRYQTSRSL